MNNEYSILIGPKICDNLLLKRYFFNLYPVWQKKSRIQKSYIILYNGKNKDISDLRHKFI